MTDVDQAAATDSPAGTAPDILCLKCGYDIRGLDESGVCPECATSVAFSKRYGRLDHADPLFVHTTAIGVTLLVVATIISLLYTGAAFAAPYITMDIPAAIVQTIMRISGGLTYLQAVAIWYLLAPETCAGVRVDRSAKSIILRWVAVICTLRITPRFFDFNPFIRQWSYGAMEIVVHVLIYLRLRDLGRRAPEPRLVTQASIAMALSIVSITFVTIIPSIARAPSMPLLISVLTIFGVLIFDSVIWWKFRQMLMNNANHARDNWALMQRERV